MSKEQFLKENQKSGEVYAGLIIGQNGEQDYHLFLIPGESVNVTWEKAKEFATTAGGELPTRQEQSLLFANCKQHFEHDWYWSSEQHAAYSDYAWYQHFGDGTQDLNHKTSVLRARAVRRVPIT